MMKSFLISNRALPLLVLCVVSLHHVNVQVSATTPQPIVESVFSGKSAKTPKTPKTKTIKEYDSKVIKADAKATKTDRPYGKTAKVPKIPKAKEPKVFKAPKVNKDESMPMEDESGNFSQHNSIEDGTSSTQSTPMSKNDDTEDSIISSTDLTFTPTPTDDDVEVSEEESIAVDDESDDSSRENSIEVSTSSTVAPTPMPVDSAGSEVSPPLLMMAILMMLVGPFFII